MAHLNAPMATYKIPFNKPYLVGDELAYIEDAVHLGHISGDGIYTKRCHDLLEQNLGVPKALLTTSCTHALELAAILLGIEPGDEVIVPSYTFVSTANAFVLRGATPVFADCREDTLNIDETLLESLITPRTKAIVVVHYAGVGCEMDTIIDIAKRKEISVIEDNAHGLFGKYKDRYLGTFGSMATQSFHETKNFMSGEGGALLINDPSYVQRAEIIREKGTDRARFFRGEVDKYTWVDVGSSFLPSDILAAFLYAQLNARDAIQTARMKIWAAYDEGLADWADSYGIRLPVIPPHCTQAHHMFYLLMPSQETRAGLIAHLKKKSILSVFHYQPLHLSEMGVHFGGRAGQCPVAEDVSERLLRLPFYSGLTSAEQAEVIETIREYTP